MNYDRKRASLANKSLPVTLRCKRLSPISMAWDSICVQAASFPLKDANWTQRSVFPETFVSSFSQKIHSGEKMFLEEVDDLRGDRIVEVHRLVYVLVSNIAFLQALTISSRLYCMVPKLELMET
ncbi:hypothetical protein GQR58_002008 [Nymphon striatum]|nr:hypothetical protein GQR58_002008 [Nymphon striatum]